MIHILKLSYLQPRPAVEASMAAHKAWVREHADAGRILLSGPRPEGGAIVVTADLDADELRKLIESDPWHQLGVAAYETDGFEPRGVVSPGVVTAPEPGAPVLLVNVALTENAEQSIDALAHVVDHVAGSADGFRGARLLTSVENDTVINFAAWESEEQFAAIFQDPEFSRRYADFAKTTESARFRLYRTSRVINPAR
ncbi:antibiotic biosynthesis monooxygenase [Kitasatospora sp. GP82]|uniref:antibiotic biosynthesis monooxygenase n=1 Tax=Kitasatospora sp. GP82 TaxID=3035089 RepID=UPI002475DF7C|nr:antibiotic biosynthesis monooxygenase [Kitasatospora sp. GP82]MDH6129514.1 uncharacterized protein YciI/heme-degrading monooxygenase HmoA [Kitasatospora sp. GP82]